ncbi:MAG TPA: hypothetical protein VGS79_11465 [Puia sp.]|nr:hypothetical protein [Puia sp.]
MKLFLNATLASTLLLITLTETQAQQYAVKESTIDVKGPQHEILACSNGDYISITYPFTEDNDPLIVARFDHALNQKYSTPIADLKKIHYQSNLYNNGRLALFCNDKDGNVNRYDVDDKTGTLTGSPAPLFTLEARETDTKFFTGNAPGRNFHYFVSKQNTKKETGTILQGVILDQQYGRLAGFSFITPENRGDFNHLDILQSDDGTLYMIYSVNVKTSKDDYTPHTYKVVMVDPKGATRSFPMAGIPKGDLGDMSWNIDGSRLSFTGLLAHERKKGYTTVFTGYIDFQKRKGAFHQTELSTLMPGTPKYMLRYRENGIPTGVELIRTLRLSDGSHVMVLEDKGNYAYQSHYAPMSPSNPGFSAAPASLAMGTMASYSITYYNRGNIYLVKTDAGNTPQWVQLVTKKQEEPDMAIAIGTACSVDNKDNVHLFFIDSKRNKEASCKSPKQVSGLKFRKSKLACVTIDPAGAMTKTFIALEKPKYRLMLEDSEGDVTGELCFMAIRKKTAFSIDHMLNHADYHIGTITITPGAAPALAGN